MNTRYNVWVEVYDGILALLNHRNRTSWTFKTAVKYAEEHSVKFGCKCTVKQEEN